MDNKQQIIGYKQRQPEDEFRSGTHFPIKCFLEDVFNPSIIIAWITNKIILIPRGGGGHGYGAPEKNSRMYAEGKTSSNSKF